MSKEKNDYWKKISDSLGEKDESMVYLYQCLFELGWDAAMTEIRPLVKNLHTKRFIWNDPLSRHSPSVEKLRELTMSSDDALLEREIGEHIVEQHNHEVRNKMLYEEMYRPKNSEIFEEWSDEYYTRDRFAYEDALGYVVNPNMEFTILRSGRDWALKPSNSPLITIASCKTKKSCIEIADALGLSLV